MADPFTLAVIGATAGAALNPNDPVKGALIGGTVGYGGATAMGLGATQAAAPIANATYAANAPQIANLTAGQAGASIGGAAVPSAFGQAANTALGGTPGTVPVGSFGNVGMRMGGFGNTMGTAAAPTNVMGMAPTLTPQTLGAAGGTPEAAGLLGGSTRDQLIAASMLMGKGTPQQPQPLPNAPRIQSRPYTGMQQPVNPQLEEERRRLMYAMPAMPQIRLI